MVETALHRKLAEELGVEAAGASQVFLFSSLRAARNHKLLIADKTIINVLADAAVLDAMESFCRAWDQCHVA